MSFAKSDFALDLTELFHHLVAEDPEATKALLMEEHARRQCGRTADRALRQALGEFEAQRSRTKPAERTRPSASTAFAAEMLTGKRGQ